MIPGSANPLLLAPAGGGYQVERSLRFNSSDSAFCSRTFSSTGNRTSWTWSGWVKRSNLVSSSRQVLFGGYGANNDIDWFEFGFGYVTEPNDSFYWTTASTLSSSAAVFRDLSAWYHILVNYNGTNIIVYINNTTVLTSSKSGNLGINGAWLHTLGRSPLSGIRYFDGYLADIHFIDGQALTPSSFTEVSATTGQLIPLAYSGTFGTNGFWLKFSDNSAATAAALGNDYSGNNNDWTPNNLSVTAGAGNDSLVDTPTSYGTDTSGVGGEVRGNYATLNPLAKTAATTALSNGNLEATGDRNSYGTIAIPASGKWYWEVTPTAGLPMIGVTAYVSTSTAAYNDVGLLYAGFSGDKWINGTNTSYGASYTSNDVIGVAVNVDAGTVTFYKNNTSQGSITYAAAGLFPASTTGGGSATLIFNFGQRAFAYPLSGFKALCDTNLPAPLTAKPSTVMDVVLYTGTGAALTPTSSLGFNPDWIWIKSRSAATDHALYDVVRGAQARLESNTTDAEVTTDGGVTAFNSAGFTLGTLAQVNTSSATYAAWCWDAGTSTVSNTDGSITSQVRANVSAGFSVVTWTGNGGTNATVGHGLGVAPQFIFAKWRGGASDWEGYHIGAGATKVHHLNTTAIQTLGHFGSTTPTGSVFTVNANGTGNEINGNGQSYVAYCFAPVVGYSSMGSYVGNGSADGPFVYTGMRPRWMMIKRTDAGGENWRIVDTARGPYNVFGVEELYPNSSAAENSPGTVNFIDALSNGFKLRNTSSGVNASGGTYIYAAFAESPFQFSRAR